MDKARLLRRMWQQLIHTDPTALSAPTADTSDWDSIWGPGERLLTHLMRLPAGLLAFWLGTGRGHILIGSAPSAYRGEVQTWRAQHFEGLCALYSADIAAGAPALWQALFACCDHLLGSRGAPGGSLFSAGSGATPRLQELAERLQTAVRLGYAAELLGASAAADYLSSAWQLYLAEPARLNTADPLSYRLLHESLMNDRYWALVLRESAQSG